MTEPETDFYINNRGIIIAAKSLSFNSIESEVTIDIGNQEDENDKYSYGILDERQIRIRRSYRTEIRSQVILKNMSVWKSLQML